MTRCSSRSTCCSCRRCRRPRRRERGARHRLHRSRFCVPWWDGPPPRGLGRSPLVLGPAAQLVEVDGGDEHRADGDVLPERIDPYDHEAVLQDGGDEDAEDRAEHRSDPAEQARPADDDGGDGLQVVGVVAADGRRREAGQRQEASQAGERAGERVDLDEVAVDGDAGAARRLLVGADRVRVAPEAGGGEDDAEDDRHCEGDQHQPGNLVVDGTAGADRRDELEGPCAHVDAAGHDEGRAEARAQGAQGDDEGGDLRLGDQEAVDEAPGHPARERDREAEEDHAPVVAARRVHRLGGDDTGEDEDPADREVDACGDDHVGHPRRKHEQHGGVGGDVASVGDVDERARVEQAEDDDEPEQDEPDPRARPRDEALPEGRRALPALVVELGLVGRRGGDLTHAASPSWVMAPVMAPTTSSIVTSPRRKRATRVPRRRTSMRSATSKTSGMLWLMRTTARPCSRTRTMRSSTWRVWTTPSAAVGSSMKTTLEAHVTARETAMPWRWPPDIVATVALESCSPTPRLLNASSARRCIAPLSRNPSLPSSPPRSTSRPRNRFAAGSSSEASARSW